MTDCIIFTCWGLLWSRRNFSDSDTETSLPVALVNQAFADLYFPTEDAVGKQIRMGFNPVLASSASTAPYTIIGVIGNSINRGLALPQLPPSPRFTGKRRT